MTQPQVKHPKKQNRDRNNNNNNDSHDDNDDRNERTVMLSRIPKHIPDDAIHTLVQNAIRTQQQQEKQTNMKDDDDHDDKNIDSDDHHEEISYIEQVTLVYPTSSDDGDAVVVEKKKHYNSGFDKQHSSSISNTNHKNNDSHTNDESRFDDRPYKKKQQKVVSNNDTTTRYQPPPSTATSSTTVGPLLPPEHCGYGFVRFHRVEYAMIAISQIKCIRFDKNNIMENNAGVLPVVPTKVEVVDENNIMQLSMKKKPKYHTMYIGPCSGSSSSSSTSNANADNNNDDKTTLSLPSSKNNQICFLWTEFRCPYGSHCKFQHSGVGGLSTMTNKCSSPTDHTNQNENHNIHNKNSTTSLVDRRKKIKCFNYRKGKCKLDATTCPYSHNFTVQIDTSLTCEPCHDDDDNNNDYDKGSTAPTAMIVKKRLRRDDSEKDCLDYVNKNGHCRKLAKNLPCPYQHDAIKLQQLQYKKKLQQKKRMKHEKRNNNKNNITSPVM